MVHIKKTKSTLKKVFIYKHRNRLYINEREYDWVHCYLCLGAREGLILEMITFPSK